MNYFLMGQCPSGRSLLIYMAFDQGCDLGENGGAAARESAKAQKRKKRAASCGETVPRGFARSERGERGEDIVCELLGVIAVQPEHDLHEIIAAFGNGGVGGIGFALEFLVGVVAEHHVAVDGGLGDLDALAVLF